MKRLMFVLGSVVLLAVFSLAAGQPFQSGGGMTRGMGGMRGMMGCSFDFSQTISMEGTVVSVDMAQGQGFPRFVLALADGKKATVVTAPFRAVLDANYKIEICDTMSVSAFPSTQSDVFGAAVLTNHSKNDAILNLRDASGAPIATPGQGNGRGRAGRGNCPCGNCPYR
jgi:hypothetical protein